MFFLQAALRLIFLIVHCHALFSNRNTSIAYNGTLTCTSGTRFCALIYYMEHDLMTSDDDLQTFIPLQCSENNSINHQITVNLTGENLISDLNYEPYIEVYHNCGGVISRNKHFLPYVKLGFRKNARNYTYKIKSRGAETGKNFFIDDALRAKELQDPVLRHKTSQWLTGESSGFEETTNMSVNENKESEDGNSISYAATEQNNCSTINETDEYTNNTSNHQPIHVQYPTKGMYKDVLVNYTGTLTCSTGKRFCAMLQYLEKDWIIPDRLGFVPVHCTEGRELHHQLVVEMTGGENDFEFEPYIHLYHDCGGHILNTFMGLTKVSMSKRTVSISFERNITGLGIYRDGTFLNANSGLEADIFKKDPDLRKDTEDWLRELRPFRDDIRTLITNGTEESE